MSQITVRAVLFGDGDPAGAISRTPGWRGVVDRIGGAVGGVSAGGRQIVEREMTSALAGLLGLDVGDVLVGGWRRHRALAAAAHATRANPTATEVVQLATHRITTAHRPYVDIIVNGGKVATIHFDLGLTVDVDGLVGTVRQARLVAIQGGRCTITAGLACEGLEIASRQAVVDPALTVRLGQGIALLDEERKPSIA